MLKQLVDFTTGRELHPAPEDESLNYLYTLQCTPLLYLIFLIMQAKLTIS